MKTYIVFCTVAINITHLFCAPAPNPSPEADPFFLPFLPLLPLLPELIPEIEKYVERGNRKLRVTTAIPEVFQTPAEENVNVPSSEELREVVSHLSEMVKILVDIQKSKNKHLEMFSDKTISKDGQEAATEVVSVSF